MATFLIHPSNFNFRWKLIKMRIVLAPLATTIRIDSSSLLGSLCISGQLMSSSVLISNSNSFFVRQVQSKVEMRQTVLLAFLIQLFIRHVASGYLMSQSILYLLQLLVLVRQLFFWPNVLVLDWPLSAPPSGWPSSIVELRHFYPSAPHQTSLSFSTSCFEAHYQSERVL